MIAPLLPHRTAPSTELTMVGLLSLPDEMIELVGERVTRRRGGLRDWCYVSGTCKLL